ncbi:MAG: hypothetical protein HC845_00970 [Akkermansiaceae bacterium]|nr:hypothetical protein [Akkermansiaceae bacterium]
MQRYLPLVLIVGLLIAFRLIGCLPDAPQNFQPLAALFFCGALLAPGWRGFAIPFAIWAVTYPFAKGPITDPAIILTTLMGLIVVFFIGKFFEKKSILKVLLGSVAASVVFHLITNGAAWIGDPMYQKNITGLWQSVWTGPVGSPMPSWVFLKNFTAANLIFTSIFAVAQFRFTKPTVSVSVPLLAK